MKEELLFSEITCPYCRIGFPPIKISDEYGIKKGNWKTLWKSKKIITGKKVEHLDLFHSYEAGLILDCKQSEYILGNIESIDSNGNPTFKQDFQDKINILKEKFYNNPSDIDKDNINFYDFCLAFKECMNYGNIEGEDESYSDITVDAVKKLYDQGLNLKECLKSFIKKEQIENKTI